MKLVYMIFESKALKWKPFDIVFTEGMDEAISWLKRHCNLDIENDFILKEIKDKTNLSEHFYEITFPNYKQKYAIAEFSVK